MFAKGHNSKKPLETVAKRFWRHVIKKEGCWDWGAYKTKLGYCSIRDHIAGKPVYAHRVSYELHFGAIPEGAVIMHKCDNPSCCNPDHLQAGTMNDNQKDMANKWRTRSKLTPDDVQDIRSSTGPLSSIAARHNISRSNVKTIRARKTFVHVI